MATTAGGKFVLTFSLEGDGAVRLREVIQNTKAVEPAAKKAGKALDNMVSMEALDRLRNFSQGMMSVGRSIVQTFVGGVTEGMRTLAPIETQITQMMSATGRSQAEARNLVAATMKMAALTPFTQKQAIDTQIAMARGGVELGAIMKDARGEALSYGDAVEKGWSGNFAEMVKGSEQFSKLPLTYASIFGDYAASLGKSGQRMDLTITAMQDALSSGRLNRLFGDIPVQDIERIFGGRGKMTVTATKAMENLVKMVIERGQVGAQAALARTVDGLMSTLEDVPTMISTAIFGMPTEVGSYYSRLTGIFGDFLDELMGMLSDTDFQKAIREVFKDIVEGAVSVGKWLVEAVKSVRVFVKEHSTLLRQIANFTFWAGVILTVAGAFLTAALAVAGFILAMKMVGATFGIVVAGMATVAWHIGLVIALLYALNKAYEADMLGFKTWQNDRELKAKALEEMYKKRIGYIGEMSDETKKALQERGLLEDVVQQWGTLMRIQAFVDGFTKRWEMAWDRLKFIFKGLGEAWDRLMQAFGGGGKNPADKLSPRTALSEWLRFGEVIGAITAGVLDAISMVGVAITVLIDAIALGVAHMRGLGDNIPFWDKLVSVVATGNPNPNAGIAPPHTQVLGTPARPVVTQPQIPVSAAPAAASPAPQAAAPAAQTTTQVAVAPVMIDGQKLAEILTRVQTRTEFATHSRGGRVPA